MKLASCIAAYASEGRCGFTVCGSGKSLGCSREKEKRTARGAQCELPVSQANRPPKNARDRGAVAVDLRPRARS